MHRPREALLLKTSWVFRLKSACFCPWWQDTLKDTISTWKILLYCDPALKSNPLLPFCIFFRFTCMSNNSQQDFWAMYELMSMLNVLPAYFFSNYLYARYEPLIFAEIQGWCGGSMVELSTPVYRAIEGLQVQFLSMSYPFLSFFCYFFPAIVYSMHRDLQINANESRRHLIKRLFI